MSSNMAIIFLEKENGMTNREIERVLEEGRRALAEKRNEELRARVAARLSRLNGLRSLCGADLTERRDSRKNREYALFH